MAVFFVWMKLWSSKRDRQLRRPFVEMSRPAGWSLLDRMNEQMEVFNTHLMMAMVTGAVCWAVAAFAGTQVLALTSGIAACSVFLFLSSKSLIRYSNCRLGLLGEMAVGQILDRVSSDTIRVFHDLEVKEAGKRPWNIDHVVLTPAGVFAIETKARRKPRDTAPDAQQGHRITFDGQQLIFPAPMKADRHGLEQAQRNATCLADKLTTLNGSPIQVTPALVFPGWWIDAKGKGSVSVLNPKGLPGYLTGRKSLLSDTQFRAINAQLEEPCRIDLTR